jgi:sulfoxide reductase heme-binding subunit YedZ
MLGINYLDISSVLGLIAAGLLTGNFLLGMMLSTAYKRSIYWQKLPNYIKKINVERLHNWTAYFALLFVLLHPFFLLLSTENKFTLIHIFFPLTAPSQKWMVLLGSLSLYAIFTVILTSQKIIKKKITFRVWKNIHLISYATALLFIVHGVLMDPLLKDRPTDWFDAEKLFLEICFLLLLIATIIRYRFHKRNH